MKKTILFLLIALLTPIIAFAHSLILSVIDNGDDTITIIGKFDTGALAEGAMVRLESESSGKVIFTERLPQESELTLAIPKEPYQIILDGGPGHISVKSGIPPRDGFAVETKKNAKTMKNEGWSTAMVVTIGTAFGLFLLTIYISMSNTKKIIEAISKAK